MKKITNILLAVVGIVIIPLFAFSQNTLPKSPKALWSLEEVKQMAKKYDVQDCVSAEKNTYLLYVDKKNLDAYFAQEAKAQKKRAESNAYLQKTKFVRTFEDHDNLINAYPSVRANIVKSRGGEEKHQEYIKAACQYKWRIYRNVHGGLAFYRADEPVMGSEAEWGQRIDNLPPAKE